MQENRDQKFPIAFASKKLLPRERAYSIVEHEGHSVVWAIKCSMKYLYGREFVIETDHQPLTYISQSKMSNGRLMRWALFLQNFKYRVVSIKGKDNVTADYLSRAY